MARDAAVAACSAAVALASSTQWRVEQLERGQEALQAAASRSREVAAAASRSAAAVGRDVERLTGEILNQIVPGLRQARSALADASIAASDTPPGGSQTLDADAMQDALPPPPSLPSVDDEDARELDYAAAGAADETQLGEPAPADDASAAADAGDETQDPLSPSPKKRGSEEHVGLAAAEAGRARRSRPTTRRASPEPAFPCRRAESPDFPLPSLERSRRRRNTLYTGSTAEVAERQAPPEQVGVDGMRGLVAEAAVGARRLERHVEEHARPLAVRLAGVEQPPII